MVAKTLREFDSLKRQDFDNGAILGEIREIYKQRDALLEALEMIWATKERASYIDVKESGVIGFSFYLDENQCAQIRVARGEEA